jgi:hypothetical protein
MGRYLPLKRGIPEHSKYLPGNTFNKCRQYNDINRCSNASDKGTPMKKKTRP